MAYRQNFSRAKNALMRSRRCVFWSDRMAIAYLGASDFVNPAPIEYPSVMLASSMFGNYGRPGPTMKKASFAAGALRRTRRYPGTFVAHIWCPYGVPNDLISMLASSVMSRDSTSWNV